MCKSKFSLKWNALLNSKIRIEIFSRAGCEHKRVNISEFNGALLTDVEDAVSFQMIFSY